MTPTDLEDSDSDLRYCARKKHVSWKDGKSEDDVWEW